MHLMQFSMQDPNVPNALSRKMMQRIVNVQWDIPEDVQLSPECHDLLSRIFVPDPTQRIRVPDIRRCCCLQHHMAAPFRVTMIGAACKHAAASILSSIIVLAMQSATVHHAHAIIIMCIGHFYT